METKEEAVEIGLQAVREMENMTQQLRDAGIRPVRRYALTTEPEAMTVSGRSPGRAAARLKGTLVRLDQRPSHEVVVTYAHE